MHGAGTRRELVRGSVLLIGAPIAALLAQAYGSSGQAPPNPPTTAPRPTHPPTTAAAKPTAAATQAPATHSAKPTASTASQSTGVATTQAAGAAKRGGTLLVGKTTEAPCLDPHRENALSRARVTQNMYSYLVQTDADLRIVPDLAEKWDISSDGTTYTFALRKGVKFHSGRDLTAADIKYSVERILDPATPSPGAGLLISVDGVETPDPATVRLHLKNPDASLLSSLASAWGGIVDKDVVEKNNGDLSKVDAGSGPFMLEEWIPDQTLKVKRFPN